MTPDEALQLLPAAYAQALRLRSQGRTERQICQALAIEDAAIRSLLRLASAKLDRLTQSRLATPMAATAVDAGAGPHHVGPDTGPVSARSAGVDGDGPMRDLGWRTLPMDQSQPDPPTPAPWTHRATFRYEEERQRIIETLGSDAQRVEEIGWHPKGGSAIPVVNILVSVNDVELEERYRQRLEASGYELQIRHAGHRIFRRATGEVYIHVSSSGSAKVRPRKPTMVKRPLEGT